LAVVKKKTR